MLIFPEKSTSDPPWDHEGSVVAELLRAFPAKKILAEKQQPVYPYSYPPPDMQNIPPSNVPPAGLNRRFPSLLKGGKQ